MDSERTILNTLAFAQVSDVLIVCSGRENVSERDMDIWLKRLERHVERHDFRVLLISARGGGTLDSRQRARLGEFWKASGRKSPRAALLTDSTISRFVMTAIGWLTGADTKAFDVGQWDHALAFLGCDAKAAEVAAAAEGMHAALDVKQRHSA